MGMTLAEKIISEHAGKDVHAGELVIANVDVAAVQDGTGPLTVQEFKKLGIPKLKNPERSILFIDHASPSPRKELSNTHTVLREFSKEYGADPIHIACIVKKESHFTEHVNTGSGKGLMQLTKIAVKDMYQRPHLYHSALDNIKKEYPTHQSLFTAIQVNPELNLRVGIIAFLQRLEKSNGDVRLALQNYNGSRNKVAYANEIMKDIKKYVA